MELFEVIGNADFGIAAVVSLIAGLMRGFVGVGSGMLMAPVFAVLFGPLETVGMVIMLDAFVTAQLLPSLHRLIEWRVVIPMAAVAALFMPLGTWLLVSVDAGLMARGIALIVLLFVLVLMSDSAATNRANFTGYFAVTLATLLAMMAVRGLIQAQTIERALFLLPIFAGGAWLGARWFYRASDQRYRQVALGLLLSVALYGVFR